MMLIPVIGRQPVADLLGSAGGQRRGSSDRLVVCAGPPRRHGGRRHRAGNHRRDARGAARGRPAFGLGLSFTPVTIGLAALRAQGTTLPDAAVDAAKAADGVILGPVSHNDYPPVAARRHQSVGRAAQAARSLRQYPPGAAAAAAFRRAAASPVDLVVARENTEGFYADRTMFAGLGRVHADAGPGAVGAQDHARRLDPDRGGRLRARHAAAARR